jgi:hypothetical protein
VASREAAKLGLEVAIVRGSNLRSIENYLRGVQMTGSIHQGLRVDSGTLTAIKSLIKDEWILMDAGDQEIGLVMEDVMILALLRRFVTALIPQTYHGVVGGQPVCEFKQNFNPFVLKFRMDFSMDKERKLDRRLGIAAAIMLGAIEGRQN